MILADLGADVIKIEPAPDGDATRQLPGFAAGFFHAFNRNKRSLAVDLKAAEGRDLVHRLAATADVVLENFTPGTLERLGLSYPTLVERNVCLIMLSTCNQGQTGPRAAQAGFGSQLTALCGFNQLLGEPDRTPVLLYGPYIDLIAVAYGGAAVLAALDHRRRTGEGVSIDLSQYEAGLQFLSPALLEFSANGVITRRCGNRDAVAAPHGCYPCRDDEWVVISCWDDDEYERLCRVIGGGTFSRHSPFGNWFEDVRALGFLRPPWGLAFDALFASGWTEGNSGYFGTTK